MDSGDKINEINFNNLLSQFMLMAMMVGLAEGMEPGHKYHQIAVGTDSKIPLTGRKKESRICGNETIKRPVAGLTPGQRRQGERYIRRWTQAMFTAETETVSDN
jgi:hypothetical protein